MFKVSLVYDEQKVVLSPGDLNGEVCDLLSQAQTLLGQLLNDHIHADYDCPTGLDIPADVAGLDKDSLVSPSMFIIEHT